MTQRHGDPDAAVLQADGDVAGRQGRGSGGAPAQVAHDETATSGKAPSAPQRSDWYEGPGLIETIWRHRVLIAMVSLIGGLLGYLAATLEPPTYQATARLLLKDPTTSAVFAQTDVDIDRQRYLENERQRVRSRAVLGLAAERLEGGLGPDAVARMVQVDASDSADVLRVSAVTRSPAQSAALADAVAIAYQEVAEAQVKERLTRALALLDQQRADLEDRLIDAGERLAISAGSPAALATVDMVTQQLATIDQQSAQLTVDAATFGSGVAVFEPAEEPGSPAAPRPKQTGAALAVVLFVVASAYAWWWAGRHVMVEDQLQPASVLKAPLLVRIPRVRGRRRIAALDPRWLFRDVPEVAEAHHLAVNALLSRLSSPQGVVAITGAGPGEGTTTAAIGMAAAAAHSNRVLLVDADTRTRGSTELLASGVPGRESGAGDDRPLVEAPQRVRVNTRERMWFLAADRNHLGPAEAARALRDELAVARDRFDLVVIDTAPILTAADTSGLAPLVDAFIIVVRRGTELERLVDVRRRLDLVDAPLMGYVFNDAVRRRFRWPRPRIRRGRRRRGRTTRT